MKNLYFYLVLLVILFTRCGGDDPVIEKPTFSIEITPTELSFTAEASQESIRIKSNTSWTLSSDQQWCTPSVNNWPAGETIVKINVASNKTLISRTATLTFSSGGATKAYTVKQDAGKEVNYVPAGYSLVWQDEFNDTNLKLPNNEWWFETGRGENGWGNQELQNYVDRISGNDTVAKIQKGSLIITAFKREAEIISARMNTSKSWTYGYFEMSAKLPGGKGTWAAFWMMPKKNTPTVWPLDGEIDIMEYVGYDKDVTHFAIHTEAYNHVDYTEKATYKKIEGAETDFHIYAVKWSEDEIIGYVDGFQYFEFKNDKTGNKETWPFNAPFYLKLNLAIGGSWGGKDGVDPNIFPARYEIDYVRVYQKK